MTNTDRYDPTDIERVARALRKEFERQTGRGDAPFWPDMARVALSGAAAASVGPDELADTIQGATSARVMALLRRGLGAEVPESGEE